MFFSAIITFHLAPKKDNSQENHVSDSSKEEIKEAIFYKKLSGYEERYG